MPDAKWKIWKCNMRGGHYSEVVDEVSYNMHCEKIEYGNG